ncbi:MAG TPA: CPBP family intramembrane glutamic endopeptidase [Gemmatimonadaceae bacterium]|nr:CPBP family intramembrane glutamic endopeptidase [Gemmatimonadaceae bacterium]
MEDPTPATPLSPAPPAGAPAAAPHEPARRARVAPLAAAALLLAAVAVVLFPRAFPTIALRIALTREQVIERAAAFARANELAPAASRSAARFERDGELQTYVELGAGGKDTLAALVRGHDVALFTWRVRFFRPGSPYEAEVDYAADGRLVGVERTLPDSARRPALPADAARALAESLLVRWGARDPARWRLATTSERTVPVSGRLDRTFTFERTDRTVGGAPIRLEARIAGDLPASVRERVEIPERFQRRYEEMRASNDFLALLAQIAVPIFGLVGTWALVYLARRRLVRWRPAAAVGTVLGVMYVLLVLNEIPTAWFDYDTATSPGTFLAMQIIGAVAAGAAMAIATALLVAMAEAISRTAFPAHVDWWGMWRNRGTREVAEQAAGGYALAAFGFAYTAAFYIATRHLLGWWAPSDVLDDPNQIATVLPWLAAIAESARAAIQEEALFRAVPLGLLAWRVGRSPHRRAILGAGVVLSALVFGFGHANYPSWPPYSRGVELFVESVLWGLVYLRWGLPPTIIAHFVYDLVWFGLFALGGSALAYRITFGVVALALLFPALAVAARALRQRGLVALPGNGRFGAWVPAAARERAAHPPLALGAPLTPARRALAGIAILAGLAALPWLATWPSLGPRFDIGRARAVAIADSVLRARGGASQQWRALPSAEGYGHAALDRFLARWDADTLRQRLVPFAPAAAWEVRFVRTAGTTAERREEWRVRLLPDGRVLDVRHEIPEDAPGGAPSPDDIRALAGAALARAGLAPAALRERELRLTPRPRRRDARVEYQDTTVRLPAGAEARVAVSLAGREPLSVRRYVLLPEEFERADRARRDDLAVAASVAAVALLLILGWSAVRLYRRDPADDRARLLAGRPLLAAMGVAALWEVARAADLLPARLAGYDTSTPWTTFRATLTLAMLLVVLIAPVAAALWLAAEEARRRLGLPFRREHGAGAHHRADTLLAGAALGLLPTLIAALAVPLAGMPPVPPATVMDRAAPLASQLLEGGHELLLLVPPALVLVALLAAGARGAWRRAALLALVALALTPLALLADPEASWWRALAAMAALVAAAGAGVWLWGRTSGATWLVAALVALGTAAVRSGLAAGTAADRWSAALAAIALLAVALWVALSGRRAPPPAPEGAPAPPRP